MFAPIESTEPIKTHANLRTGPRDPDAFRLSKRLEPNWVKYSMDKCFIRRAKPG